jgi:hypothetical protein
MHGAHSVRQLASHKALVVDQSASYVRGRTTGAAIHRATRCFFPSLEMKVVSQLALSLTHGAPIRTLHIYPVLLPVEVMNRPLRTPVCYNVVPVEALA